MASESIFDKTRKLGKRSGHAIADQESTGSKRKPASKPAKSRKKPKATAMAPREGGKKKSYGRDTDTGQRKMKGGKYRP